MTSIQWTDETWNPVTGCSRVSEGCRHCYIERTPPFRMAGRKLGDPVQLHPDRLDQPLHWRKPRRVFVNSLSDLFHEDVPDEFVFKVFRIMARSQHHTFQVLTKRPERMRNFCKRIAYIDPGFNGHPFGTCSYWPNDPDKYPIETRPLPNVHLGVSVEDQQTADERIPILLQTPAAVRFLSVEPLLGPVQLGCGGEFFDYGFGRNNDNEPRIHWVIVGGESGPKARPCDVAWIRSIVQQCKAAQVPCFVKQLGRYVIDRNDAGFDGEMPTNWPMDTDVDDPENDWSYQAAKIRIRLKDTKGGDPTEWPEDLRVREWPRSTDVQAG